MNGKKSAINTLKEKLIIANRIIDMENLATPMGHISVRIPGTDTFLISRNIAPGEVASVDDMIVCDLQGKVIQGKGRVYGEIMGHAAVYKRRKDLNSVAHIHPANVIAMSMTGKTLLMASSEAMQVGYKAPIGFFKKTYYLAKPEICEEVADMIGPNFAVILKAHGALVVGRSVEECTVLAIRLETAAQYQLMASAAGKLELLTKEEMATFAEYLEQTAKLLGADWEKEGTGSSIGRAWEYYRAKVKK